MKENTAQEKRQNMIMLFLIQIILPVTALASSGISSGGFIVIVMYFLGPFLLIAGIFYILSKTNKNNHNDDEGNQ